MTTTAIPITQNGPTQTFDTETLLTIATSIRQFVVDQGQATKNEIRAHVKTLGYPTEAYQKALTMLHDTMGVTTEITNDDGTKALRLKRQEMEIVDLDALYKTIIEAKGPKTVREKFGLWFHVTGRMTLFTPSISSRPVVGSESSRQFLHDQDGRTVLVPIYFQKMLQTATTEPDAPVIGNGRFKIRFDPVFIPPHHIRPLLNPVPPAIIGGTGQGLTNTESLPSGTTIPFHAVIPATHCSRDQFEDLMHIAGRRVGFSPAAAGKGWGYFSVEFDPPPSP